MASSKFGTTPKYARNHQTLELHNFKFDAMKVE